MKKLKLNKKTLIIIGSCLAVIIIIILGFLLLKNDNQEKTLIKKLKNMGSDFYENFYFSQVGSNEEERSTFLKKYATIGIKVNLDNLSRYNGQDSKEVLEEFVNKETNKACDIYATQVIIYPQDPYTQNSYKMEATLECGF